MRDITRLWAGRITTGVAVLFLGFDATGKLLAVPEAVKATTELGFASSALTTLAIIQLVCLALYVLPKTAVLGAVLWTGYLGGAIATHFRLGNPLMSHTLFPLYVAGLVWAGVWLREPRLRTLLPLRSTSSQPVVASAQ